MSTEKSFQQKLQNYSRSSTAFLQCNTVLGSLTAGQLQKISILSAAAFTAITLPETIILNSGQTAAAIVKGSVNRSFTTSSPSFTFLNFDGGGEDVYIGNPGGVSAKIAGDFGYPVNFFTTNGYVKAFSAGNTIAGPGTNFINNGQLAVFSPSNPLEFGDAGPKYVGFLYGFSPYKYGWISVQVFMGTKVLNVNDWAYEDVNGLGIIAGEKENSLPVELSSFTAESKNNTVELKWSTESEKDNVGFVLDRRLAGDLDWTEIASFKTDDNLKGHNTATATNSYEFIDKDIKVAETYEYRLSDVDINGTIKIKKIVAITVEATPINFTLNQNYPNPFNPTTTIDFALTEAQNVNLSIYNMAGQLVETLIDVELNAGNHSTEWNAANVPAGTYFYQLQAGTQKEIKKAVLLK